MEVIRVLLGLRALLGTQAGPPVVAAVRDGRHLPAARMAAGPRGMVLETDLTTARLLVQSARSPGLSTALRDLLDFAGAEFHVVDAPELVGLAFADVALRYEARCVVGLLRTDGRALLAPAPGAVLGPGDRLVVVAHDDTAAPPTDCGEYVDPAAMTPPGPRPAGPTRTLLLGWNRRAPLVVEILSASARPGSVLDVVTAPDAGPGPILPPGAPDNGRLGIAHHVGHLDRPEVLRTLDLFGYDSIIALGPDPGTGPGRPDDHTLLNLLMLRRREEEAGRALPVVAELCDPRSRVLAPLGPSSDAVVRGELTALLMTQIAHNPELAAVFEEVFATRGGALALRPAEHYVLQGHEASFATVVAAALERGECVIGYRARGAHVTGRDVGLRLCPRKAERRFWDAGDEVLVLTAAATDPSVADGGENGLPQPRRQHEGGDSPAGVPTA
ncbi:hypothetical protein [Streptomyces sp. NPDC058964]|uniref:CASTOR/POLLUX-related putative ion channel n=1 Tax=Streptomyces sp. NPDC058964 TaxID=3346681 RepID=UPI0036B3B6E3